MRLSRAVAEGTTIPAALVTWCDAVARATALLLYCCERQPPDPAVRLSDEAADELLEEAARELASGVFSRPAVPGEIRGKALRLPLPREPRGGIMAVERRLAKLVLSKWASTVRPNSPARPDVLALTSRLLTNPDAAFTYHVARFSLLAALRSLYGVSHDQGSLALLRMAYNRLRGHADVSVEADARSDARHQALILDVLHVEGWIPRHLPEGEPRAYYERFAHHVLGVPHDLEALTPQEHPVDLRSRLPDFGTLQGLLFAHPTGVAGLDFVTGGLLPAIQDHGTGEPGGLATLIYGPPGTGKTSLCLTLGTRMAELGSSVAYVTTEEGRATLESKRQSLVEPLSVSLAMPLGCVERLASPRFRVIDGSEFTSLTELSELLARSDDMPSYARPPAEETAPELEPGTQILDFTLVFPRVVVIDSVTALLQLSEDRAGQAVPVPASPPRPSRADAGPVPGIPFTWEAGGEERAAAYPTRSELRRTLAHTLNVLRSQGVCLILVGGEEDRKDEALAYLVDNVFALSVEEGEDWSHPRITLELEKMRLQNTQRERHVFHLAGPDGPTVSPSLHAVLRRLDRLPHQTADASVRAFVWERERSAPQGNPCGTADRSGPDAQLLTIGGRSQTLIYGFGASGKSRFAMSLAMEARIPVDSGGEFEAYMARRAGGKDALTTADRHRLSEARVLVVSFQYGPEYYGRLATEVLRQRFACTSRHPEKHVDVIDFYPGAVEAESVVRRVRMRLRHGEVSGKPHTAVVLDGVHNIVAQFPGLASEPLLWPTLYQLFRTYGIDSITTFTFFRIPSPTRGTEPNRNIANATELHAIFDRSERTRKVRDVEEDYFQTLATSCDYSFEIEPPLTPPHPRLRNVVRIQLSSSVDRDVNNAPLRIIWDADAFSQKQDYPVKYDIYPTVDHPA